ncbi:MAG: exodeoxyribonuclease gamma subunit [Burkholderiaceae bacterium]|nr:exodeoxyribonuclease gamma subunit [Burkholderiaceae bacterium]
MLTITFSNRFEPLLDILLARLEEPPPSPFITEQIIVPNAAMRRKLELAIADRFGICANTAFSPLRAWLTEQMLPSQQASPYAPEVLAWQIFRRLGDTAFTGKHPRLSGWLDKADATMRHDLANQIARLLAQYLVYRPEWIAAWNEGKPAALPGISAAAREDLAWQSELWRSIMQENTGASYLTASDAWLNQPPSGATAHLFCLPEIAPLYIDLLGHLGQSMDLHLYLLNPCREYWFDIVDQRRLGYLKAKGLADYHETGNRLLAAWGRQSRAMIELLFDRAMPSCDEQTVFISNAEQGKHSLLTLLQDAILNLAELPAGGIQPQSDDRSIEIHVCHSLTRELEVLQDRLLALFGEDSSLKPDDVLVVTPELDQAAPLIDAIFGTAQAARRIPYSIAGRNSSRINPAAAALLDLLSVASSRAPASAVFKLLQQPIIARRFELQQADLEAIHGWMTEAGIRWGLNARHRQQLNLPATERYSFDDGLNRLFLAYALPSGGEAPFGQRLPAGNPEGSAASALGGLWQFVRQFDALQCDLRQAKTPEQWRQTLLALADAFLSPEGNEQDDWREVRQRIGELCSNMQAGCGELPIPADVLHGALDEALDDSAHAGVPTGMVTFASMASLRNLPYRVICAIGLNDGSFPSWQRPLEFDLMEQQRQRGDRQRRHDERNLFLDLLLATRERLHLSYTGRSVRDNAPLPPSVLVADLLDCLHDALATPEARQKLTVEHPLQPFSFACFQRDGDARRLSSNAEYHAALSQKLRQPLTIKEPPAAPFGIESDEDEDEDEEGIDRDALLFFDAPLPSLNDEWRHVSLEQMLRFFRNPCSYLLQQRLGIAFPEQPEDLADDEPFLPEWAEKNALADRLLPLYLSGATDEAIRVSAAAGTEYPPGEMGQALLEQELAALNQFADEWRHIASQPTLPPVNKTLEFTLDSERWQLSGAFSDLRPAGLLRCRFDDTRATDYLAGWLHHLLLNAIAPDGVERTTTWHSRDGQYTLQPVDNAREQLQQLLSLYRQGLNTPLHFFPKSAWTYARTGNLGKAASVWQSWNDEFGEGKHPAYRLALRGADSPLDEDFTRCAKTVFAPLLDHINDSRLK